MRKESINTYDEVVQWLRDAHAAVDEAEIPEDLRAVAFGHALQFVSAQVAVQDSIVPPMLTRH